MEMIAHNLSLYASTPLPDALGMPHSDAYAFFEGKAFADWRKGKEGELKLQAGIADRLNNVIRACGAIVKTIAGSRR
jgi:hypothetical protein